MHKLAWAPGMGRVLSHYEQQTCVDALVEKHLSNHYDDDKTVEGHEHYVKGYIDQETLLTGGMFLEMSASSLSQMPSLACVRISRGDGSPRELDSQYLVDERPGVVHRIIRTGLGFQMWLEKRHPEVLIGSGLAWQKASSCQDFTRPCSALLV